MNAWATPRPSHKPIELPIWGKAGTNLLWIFWVLPTFSAEKYLKTSIESQNYTSERSFMGVSLMKLVVFIWLLGEKVIWRAVILPRGTWQVISLVRIDFHMGVEEVTGSLLAEDWGILCLCLCISSDSILQIYEIVPPVGWGVLFWRRARSKEGGSQIPRFQGRGLHKLREMCVEQHSPDRDLPVCL